MTKKKKKQETPGQPRRAGISAAIFCSLSLSQYTYQLSCIMRESGACRSKIVISRIQSNFSRLTVNSECNCSKTDQIKIQLFFDV